jgi:hypothetical protein
MGVLESGNFGHGQQSEGKYVIQHGLVDIHILNSQELLHMTFI